MADTVDILRTLNPKVRELVLNKGWSELTEPQLEAIPYILKGYNTLIIAPTGYGKTEAALIPILSEMVESDVKPITLLYITPLRALINDLMIRIKWWAEQLGFIVARKHGDVPQSERAKRLRKTPHILIITPESLEIDLDWASRFREYYSNVKWVIVDEVHELVGTKRGIQLAVLLERLKEISRHDIQIVGLSATIGKPEEAAKMIFGSSKRPSTIINVRVSKDFEVKIDYVESQDNDLWNNAVKTILRHVDPPSLVFVNSRFTAERLHEAIEKMGLKDIAVHHSSVSREARQEAEELLRKGVIKAVICTKTLELGIDVGAVRSVIQFRPPGSVTSLIQRIGRSNHHRGGKSVGAIICVDDIDLIEAVASVRLLYKGILESPATLKKPLDVLARELMGMCLQYGEVDLWKAYEIVKRAYPYKDLQKEEYLELVKYLVKSRVLDLVDNKLKLGPVFYKIWRFEDNARRWWMRNFSEFFSFIGERKAFTVKYNDKNIGDVDAIYVYKYLRVGDVFRLAGKTWKVLSIDENLMRIDVMPTEVPESEVPLWKGETVRRDKIIAEEASRILREVYSNDLTNIVELSGISKTIYDRLYNLVKVYNKLGIPIPSSSRIVVERLGSETIFTVFLGEKISNTIAHLIMYLISARQTLNVGVRSTFYGFSVKSLNVDALELLREIRLSEIDDLIRKAIARSPIFMAVLREIQLSFGKIGRVNDDDEIIVKEAINQVLQLYFDINGTKEFIQKLQQGSIEVIDVGTPEILSPLAAYILRVPEIRPWIPDISGIIVKTLDGMAFTIDELSEILGLPPKTIEHKLKDMRKPEVLDRVFQFLDVELGEWRWGLIRDIKEIVESEIFAESFSPPDINEAFMLHIKPQSGESFIPIYFTPREILNNPEDFKKKIPVNEAYEVRVISLSSSLLQSLSPKYYYVSKEIMPYIALNGAAFLQKLKGSV